MIFQYVHTYVFITNITPEGSFMPLPNQHTPLRNNHYFDFY